MFDRFTDRARHVMGFSRQEAQRCSHDYIGTEHILLGLLLEGTGCACDVLSNLEVDRTQLRGHVQKLMTHGTTTVTMGQVPFTPRAKMVLELAYEEASNLGHNYIGTEHLLLGLIREREGLAAQALRAACVEVDDVRDLIRELLGVEPPAKWKLRFIGLDDDAFPQKILARVKEHVRELTHRQCPPGTRPSFVAFAPERDPRIMFKLGFAHGKGARVILLHLPGEKFELPNATCLEVNDELPARLVELLG